MYSFPPCVKDLFELLSFDWPDPVSQEQAEDTYPVHSALVDWTNNLYSQIGVENYEHGVWPASHQLVSCLSRVLIEYCNTNVAPQLAYTLARCGPYADDPLVRAHLCPWDDQLFKWKREGLSGKQLIEKVASAGLHPKTNADTAQELDNWISEPERVLHSYSASNVSRTLFKGLTSYISLYSNGDDLPYEDAVKSILATALPPLQINNVVCSAIDHELIKVTDKVDLTSSLGVEVDTNGLQVFVEPETFWKISFEHQGNTRHVYIPGSFAWMNDKALGEELNKYLASINHPQRVHKFKGSRYDDGAFWGQYILAEPNAFTVLCEELGIPLAW